jgi:hypothetical protein
MGNGQHRNRRGARPRPGPHKHGGAGNAGRAEMRLIPPIAPAIVAGERIAPARATGVEGGEQSAEPVSARPTSPGALAAELDIETEQDALSATPEEPSQAQPSRVNGHAPQPMPAAESLEGADEVNGARTPDSDTPRAGRGRFDRFYTPGQGARVERVAPPINPTPPTAVSAPPTPPRRAERFERASSASNPVDEDDAPDYTGPRGDVRGDVRGNVGTLIDSLHEVFVRDRTIASQGGASRCGVCYLHFPVSELLYRDAEGFYVCESCAHALGPARVPMVRRQQRQ